MSDKKVRFYLAFNSPYSFLGSTRIDEAIAPFGAMASSSDLSHKNWTENGSITRREE